MGGVIVGCFDVLLKMRDGVLIIGQVSKTFVIYICIILLALFLL